MGGPSPRTAGFRDDFILKVMAAAQSRDPDIVAGVLRAQRGFLLRELRNLESLRTERATDPVVSLLLSAATRHVGADLAFLDDAEQRLLSHGGRALPNSPRSGLTSNRQPCRARQRAAEALDVG